MGKMLMLIADIMTSLAVYIVRLYRYCLSPFIGYDCRFYPSCSCYAEEALQKYGILRGGYLTLRRLLRCHPFREGGVDLVP